MVEKSTTEMVLRALGWLVSLETGRYLVFMNFRWTSEAVQYVSPGFCERSPSVL